MQAWEWDRQLMRAWGMGQVVDASLGMAANTGSYDACNSEKSASNYTGRVPVCDTEYKQRALSN